MSIELTKEQKQERVLAVIYRLSKGICGVPVKKTDLWREINDLGVMRMGEEEFQAFKAAEVAKVKSAENGSHTFSRSLVEDLEGNQ